MLPLKDKYQIEETSTAITFKPFHHYRVKLKWYALAALVSGGLAAYNYERLNQTFLTIFSALSLLSIWFFVKEWLIDVPTRYTFDKSSNSVYQSHLFFSKRKIMNLDEVVIFQSSEMGSWHYKIGKRKNQFVKNYQISESFSNKNENEKQIAYEQQILDKIEQMTQKGLHRR